MAPVRAVWGFCPSATTTVTAVTDSQHPELHRSPSRHSPSSTAQSCLNAVSADRVRAKDLSEPIRAIVLNDFCESSQAKTPQWSHMCQQIWVTSLSSVLSSSLLFPCLLSHLSYSLIVADAGIDVMMRRGSDVVLA